MTVPMLLWHGDRVNARMQSSHRLSDGPAQVRLVEHRLKYVAAVTPLHEHDWPIFPHPVRSDPWNRHTQCVHNLHRLNLVQTLTLLIWPKESQGECAAWRLHPPDEGVHATRDGLDSRDILDVECSQRPAWINVLDSAQPTQPSSIST